MTVSERIYQIMGEKKMKQSLVAKAAGFSPSVFNSILKGRKIFRMEYVDPVCKALDVSPDELFGWDGKEVR